MDSEIQQRLLSEVASGNQVAFKKLYDFSYSRLFAVALNLLKHPDRAEEAVQESYIKIWHNAAEYHAERGAVMTWMTSILRYRCLDALRSQKIRDERHQTTFDSDSVDVIEILKYSDAEPTMNSQKQAFDHCWKQLDNTEKQTIALSYLHGLSHADIVRQIDAPLGSVKSWIRRGIKRLQRCLAE